MRVYVAGRTTDIERVRSVIAAVEKAGHEITFDWTGSEGEIRTDLDPKDLVVENYTPRGIGPQTIGYEAMPSCKITHEPTGVVTVGEGRSLVQAHDQAMKRMRSALNAGWGEDPERASELAQRERQAVWDADVVVLCWSEDILGAAIEVGMAMGDQKQVIVFGQKRDSVFWYLPNVDQTDTIEGVIAMLGVEVHG